MNVVGQNSACVRAADGRASKVVKYLDTFRYCVRHGKVQQRGKMLNGWARSKKDWQGIDGGPGRLVGKLQNRVREGPRRCLPASRPAAMAFGVAAYRRTQN